MPKRTIYVRDGDAELWAKAEAMIGEDSLSGLLADALRAHVERSNVGEMVAATIHKHLSGGAANTDPSRSLGGVKSYTVAGTPITLKWSVGGRIEVAVQNGPGGKSRRVAFAGHWLIDPMIGDDPKTGKEMHWRVAVTDKGRFAVYQWMGEPANPDGASLTSHYGPHHLEQVLPADIYAAVLAELGKNYVEELDI